MARFLAAFTLIAILHLPNATPACSLCPYAIKKDTLSQELQRAKIVLYGHVTGSKLNVDVGSVPGSGTSEFAIEKVLKTDPFLKNAKSITLDRYLPIPDPKNPPRFLLFCDVFQGKLDTYQGRSVQSPKVIDYLEKAKPHQARGRVEALVYYSAFLDHPETALAEDAFLEFAKSNDSEVGAAAKRLTPERFRTLMTNAKDADRLSLYAFLLGAAGTDKDADFLRAHIDRPSGAMRQALDGLLCGYVSLRPQEGWNRIIAMLADRKQDFTIRMAVLRACRFLYNWKPMEHRIQLVKAYQGALPDPDLADLAIEDLRRWQIWTLTPDILDHFGKESHDAPITRRTIVRYALACPSTEARQFIDRVREMDRELVADQEEALMFEKQR